MEKDSTFQGRHNVDEGVDRFQEEIKHPRREPRHPLVDNPLVGKTAHIIVVDELLPPKAAEESAPIVDGPGQLTELPAYEGLVERIGILEGHNLDLLSRVADLEVRLEGVRLSQAPRRMITPPRPKGTIG